MAENTNTDASTSKTPVEKTAKLPLDQKRKQRKKLRAEARTKHSLKVNSDKEFAKKYFDERSKRSIEKKTQFRKKKSTKK